MPELFSHFMETKLDKSRKRCYNERNFIHFNFSKKGSPLMNRYDRKKTQQMTTLAILSAIVVVLQCIGYAFARFGMFPPSLVLVPIVLGGILLGVGAGTFLGFVFGVVTLIAGISGIDASCQLLWSVNAFWCAFLCLAKATAAGALSGLFAEFFMPRAKKYPLLGVLPAAVVAPIVNTGIFLLGMVLCYWETLLAWAGGTAVISYLFIGLAGVNFLLELGINLILSPVILRIIKAKQSK